MVIESQYMDHESLTDEELQKKLTPEEYRVLRQAGTEAPYSGEYVDNHDDGMYHCKVCGAALFSSDKKFDSGSGWPSFTDPAVAENVGTRLESPADGRTEVYCKHCDSHLGHVFNDGPVEAGGKRYCINSVCLAFEQGEEKA